MFEAIDLLIAAVMVGTAFLSGIFGMAGGMILIGILLALLPLPEAMALHAITQIASNGWRALLWRRFVHWRRLVGFVHWQSCLDVHDTQNKCQNNSEPIDFSKYTIGPAVTVGF